MCVCVALSENPLDYSAAEIIQANKNDQHNPFSLTKLHFCCHNVYSFFFFLLFNLGQISIYVSILFSNLFPSV